MEHGSSPIDLSIQDLLGDVRLVDEADDSYASTAFRAGQGIGLRGRAQHPLGHAHAGDLVKRARLTAMRRLSVGVCCASTKCVRVTSRVSSTNIRSLRPPWHSK